MQHKRLLSQRLLNDVNKSPAQSTNLDGICCSALRDWRHIIHKCMSCYFMS